MPVTRSEVSTASADTCVERAEDRLAVVLQAADEVRNLTSRR